jgi:uncharacterized membrane protein
MYFNILFLKNEKTNLILIFSILILFISLPLVKLFNSNATFFDLGFYLNKIQDIQLNNKIFLGHFEFYLYFIKKFLNIFLPNKFHGYGLIIIQSCILLMPVFFIKKKIILYSYLLNPIIWNLNIFDFHSESFGFVLIFFIFKFFLEKKDNHSNFFLFLLVLIKETFVLFIILFIVFRFFERKKIDFLGLLLIFTGASVFFLFFIQNYTQDESNYVQNISNLKINFKNTFDIKFFLFFVIQIYLIILLPKKYFFKIILFFVIPQNLIFLKIAAYEQLSILTHHYVYLIAPIISILIINSQKKIFTLLTILTLTISSFPISIISIGDIYKTSSIKNYLISFEDFEFNSFLYKNFEKINQSHVVVDNNVINNFTVSFDDFNVFPSLKEYSLDIDKIKTDLKNTYKVTLILRKNKKSFFLHDRVKDRDFYEKYKSLYGEYLEKIIFDNSKYTIYQ